MLDDSSFYANELRAWELELKYTEYIKFYTMSPFFINHDQSTNTSVDHDIVSVFKRTDDEGNVKYPLIGHIFYTVNRNTMACSNFSIINYRQTHHITFTNDVIEVVHDIFTKFNYNKLNFNVVIGNPVERQYDKLIKEMNGRIVGVMDNDVKLFDNKMYDVKFYEITREQYRQSPFCKKVTERLQRKKD